MIDLVRSRGQTRPWLLPLIFTVAGVVAVLAIASVVAVLHAVRLEHRVSALPAMLQAAEVDAEDGRLAQAQNDLLQAQQVLGSVNSALYNSLDFDLVDFLPVAHQNLAAIRHAVSLGIQMVGGGEEILRAAAPLSSPDGHLEVPLSGGRVPLAVTQAVQSSIEDVLGYLPLTATPPDGSLLIGRIRGMESRVYAQALERRTQLASVANALSLIDDISGVNGDRRYVIAVSNSAEMRGSGGMYLAYGVITSHAGKVTLVRFADTSELALTRPETAVKFPADFMKTYGDLGPTTDWRQANIMSDFTVDAPVLLAMYKQATGLTADGVIQVDSSGLAALLAGVGPVQTPDLGTVTADNVVALTLNQAYFLYPNRTQRQDYTGEAAKAAFARLLSGQFPSLRALGTALFHAGLQRHLLMYAADPTDETTIRLFGFAGGLPASGFPFVQLTVQNVGGNKLDYYLSSSLTLSGQKPSQIGSRFTADITLNNTAPPGQTAPVELFGVTNPDVYQGLVTLYLPPGSALISGQGDGSVTTTPRQDTQNGVRTVTYTVSIPAGSASHVTLNLFMAPTHGDTVYYLSSPRVRPTLYTSTLH